MFPQWHGSQQVLYSLGSKGSMRIMYSLLIRGDARGSGGPSQEEVGNCGENW